MPRTKLDVMTPERQREITNKIIRHAMIEKGVETMEELAALMGKDVQVIRRRFREGKWSIEELQKLVRVLDMRADDAAKMLGCRFAA